MFKNKLNDEFKIDAKWVFPDSEKIEFGTLKYSLNDIIVELPDSGIEFNQQFSTVVGRNQKNVISLYNVKVLRKSNKHLNKTTLIAESMLIDNKKVDDIESLLLDSIIFSTDKLRLFLDKQVWNRLDDRDGIKLSKVPKKDYEIPFINATLTIHYSPSRQSDITAESGHVIMFKTFSYLEIKYNDSKEILEIKKDVQKICKLLSVLSGAPQIIDTFNFESVGKDLLDAIMPNKAHFYFQQGDISRKNHQKLSSAYKLEDINDVFGIIVSKYLEEYSGLATTIQHLTILISYKNLLESSYIDAVTSLESTHNKFYNDKKEISGLTEQAIVELKEKLKAMYQDSTDDEMNEKEQLILNLKNITRKSLRMKLMEILTDIPMELKKKLKHQDIIFTNDEDVESFVKKAVKTRNNFAHGNSDKVFDIHELYSATYILSMIAEFHLMKKIGIDEDVIIKGITNTKMYENFLDLQYHFRDINHHK